MTIDCNATLGNWPFRRLRHSDPEGMLALMDRLGIDKAWVSSFEGIFYNAVQEANEQLAEALRGHEERLVHFPVVNPNYPGWEDDLAECLSWPAPGFRLHPSYHGYALDAPPCLEMLARVGASLRDARPIIQIAVRVQDERHHHRLAMVEPVNVAPLVELCARFAQTAFIVLNATAEMRALTASGCPENLYFDISHVEGIGGVGRLAQEIGAEHILFGTHAPLLIAESAVLKMKETDLGEEEREAILGGNARRVLTRVAES